MNTTSAAKLTTKQTEGLRWVADGTGRSPHGSTVNTLTALGLIEDDPDGFRGDLRITDAGRAAL